MRFIDKYFEYKPASCVYGLTKELNILYIANFFRKYKKNVIVLANTLYEANNIYKNLKTYVDGCLLFPMDDFLTSVAISISPDFKIKRLEVLEILTKEKDVPHLVVTSLMGYLKFLPQKADIFEFILESSSGNISREIILEQLEKFGYERTSLVTTTGEYAVRGFIIDIFPIQSERPIRIEFFGDEIESIKEFDENTQRSLKSIDKVAIKKINEEVIDAPDSILDFMPENSVFLIDETQILSSYKSLVNDMYEYRVNKNLPMDIKFMFDYESLHPSEIYKIDTINNLKTTGDIEYESREINNFNSDLEKLKIFCKQGIAHNTIIFVLNSSKQIEIIRNLFQESYLTDEGNIFPLKINILEGNLNNGFIFKNNIVIAPNDIDNVKHGNIKYKNTIKIGRKVKSYTDLALGDYIVHETYGIGIYNGLKTIKTGNIEKDYIQISYLDSDKVYVPVENIDRLYKYSTKDGTKPKLNKLNSNAWAKKKMETRKKIRDISGELIELYSNRQRIKSVPYRDYDEELEFAFNFPYTLTDDQAKTIDEISADLRSDIPMDRLLCGDVGYGKTEVAFRAMFKTVLNGFQVAYLCPTTILSKQQYTSALERFKDFPIHIELLNRHVSAKKFNEILKRLANGTVDIVIGTHKLLNKKIKYAKLGLLVIDEEQRFGVSHKEKLKEMKTDVNVLTLSATPIPRTLKMAMSGIRSLSILDTPPINRYPIQTYVIEESDLIIRDAIYKELTRSGQVYILMNNIEEMEKLTSRLKISVPEAKIISAHGKMSSTEINAIMEDFVDGEYDILVCTTIIETGIDIPNVNTIIILDADRFGLSQLYQIRGRVGRSDKIAYAYLMYNPAKILTETATKRLNSIKEFTELGSGYKIAMRDLSIRGAGDLLGSEQAGFIDAVGLDLYTKMINEEVNKIRGVDVQDEEESLKPALLNVDTHIKDDYVADENVKIEIHKLINSIKNKRDLENVKSELEDRFGPVGEEIEIYMFEKCTEQLMKELEIETVTQLKNQITMSLSEKISDLIDGEKLFMEAYSINPKFKLSYKNKMISISLNTDSSVKNYIYYFFDLLSEIRKEVRKLEQS